MKISEHFTLEELIYSETAEKLKINNKPTDIHLKVLKHTCDYFFEPMRKLANDYFKVYQNKQIKSVSVKITSGYRSSLLNSKISGSSSTSQHCKAEAFDFELIATYSNNKKITISYIDTYEFIKYMVKLGKLSVDQCICEQSGNSTWVHASYSSWGSSKNRKEFLKYKNGKYILDCRL